ncbi:MAG: hypothetical protein KY445_00955 [Armatimonadetes bacterium]|nr:hypothetical protein [Armatimonadota bacterium]
MNRKSLIQSASAEVALKNPLRRAVRIQARNGDQIIGKTKSFTQAQGVEYHPAIDCQSFEFHCDCKDFECRKRACKHVKRLALNLVRRGDLPAVFFERAGLACCHQCGEVKSLYPMCAADGARLEGVFICAACVAATSGKAPTPQEIWADTENEDWEMPEAPLGYVEETKPDEARIEIEQLRRFADYLDSVGEGASAAYSLRKADHFERSLQGREAPPIITAQNEETEGGEDEDSLAAMKSNCPCGRSFRGADFDHVCPSCLVTLREAWRLHRSRQAESPVSELDDDPFADSALFVPAEAARGLAFYHEALAL